MATFNITTSQNFTALTSKAGEDTYNVNGGTLTIDSDVRYGPNCSPTTGPVGDITVSSSAGGALIIDGTKVAVMSYNTGSGNVPAAGTTISQGGVSAELLCVQSALNAAPTTAGSAMPSAGFIKVRNVTGGAFANGALTGIAATVRGGGQRVGWIEVVMVGTHSLTCGRLGSVTMTGDWYRPINTNGSYADTNNTRGQTIQLPCPATRIYYPGVWVETGSGTDIYEEWPNAANLVDSGLDTSGERGRFCWISDAGVLRFGSDGTNNVGQLPPNNCKIRVPNIILSGTNSTVGFGVNRVLEDYTNQRPGFNFTGNAPVSMTKVTSGWANNFTLAYSLTLSFCAFLNQLYSVGVSSPISVTNCIVSDRDTSVPNDYVQAQFTQQSAGGTVDDCIFARLNTTGSYIYGCWMAGNGLLTHRNRVHGLVTPTGGNYYTFNWSGKGCRFEDNESIGGTIWLGNLDTCKVLGTRYSAASKGTTPSSPTFHVYDSPAPAVFNKTTFDGVSWMVSGTNACHPNGNILRIVDGSSSVTLRNLGNTFQALNLGSTNPTQRVLEQSYQALTAKVACQKIFTTACASNNASFVTDYGHKNLGFENVRSLGTTALNLKQANGYVRGVRTPQAPTIASAVVGMHYMDYFLSDTVGAIDVLFTDPTSETSSQVTILSGSPKFTGDGKLICKTVGDSIKFTMKYFAQGHTALNTLTMTSPGTGSYTVEFRYDNGDGTGFSSFRAVNPTNLAAVTISPTTGIRLDIKITCTTANATPIDTIRINTVSTLVAQNTIAYPLDPVAIAVSGIIAGSRLLITRTDTSVVVYNDIVSGTSFSEDFDLVEIPVKIELRKGSAAPYYQPWFTTGVVADDGLAVTAVQIAD